MISKRLALRAVGCALAGLSVAGLIPAYAADLKLEGTFTGESSGSVTIVRMGDVTKLMLKDDFRLGAAPDAKLAFGHDGYIKGTIFSKLNKPRGAQEYVIPASVDLSKYNEVWIWCEQVNVPLGSAKLK